MKKTKKKHIIFVAVGITIVIVLAALLSESKPVVEGTSEAMYGGAEQ